MFAVLCFTSFSSVHVIMSAAAAPSFTYMLSCNILEEIKKIREENVLIYQKINTVHEHMNLQWQKQEELQNNIIQIKNSTIRLENVIMEIRNQVLDCKEGLQQQSLEAATSSMSSISYKNEQNPSDLFTDISDALIHEWYVISIRKTLFVRRLARAAFRTVEECGISCSHRKVVNDPKLAWIKAVFFKKNPDEENNERIWIKCCRAIDDVCFTVRKKYQAGYSVLYDDKIKSIKCVAVKMVAENIS